VHNLLALYYKVTPLCCFQVLVSTYMKLWTDSFSFRNTLFQLTIITKIQAFNVLIQNFKILDKHQENNLQGSVKDKYPVKQIHFLIYQYVDIGILPHTPPVHTFTNQTSTFYFCLEPKVLHQAKINKRENLKSNSWFHKAIVLIKQYNITDHKRVPL